MTRDAASPALSLRILFGGADMMGPGKAELLERIAASGSIAGAAREMEMSYKRAWGLIETLNAMFDMPLVASARGGPGKGGAVLTERGHEVLAAYREVQQTALAGAAAPLARLQSWLGPAQGDQDGD